MSFTTAWVKSVQPGLQPTEYMDGTTGLGLRVRPNGRKVWFARYTFNQSQTRHNLGEFPDMALVQARESLADLNRKVEAGIDPKGRKVSVDGMSVSWLCDDFIARHSKPNKRSWELDKYILDKDVKPAWGDRHISSITKRDVIDLIDGIVDRGAPVIAKRSLACITTMFNWAVKRDYLEHPPTYLVVAPVATKPRRRVLSSTEIVRLWHAMDETKHFSVPMVIILRLGLILLQRRGEIVGMRVDELNLRKKVWMLPAERTKAGREHIVPLPEMALQLIRLAMRLSPSKVFVFGMNQAEPLEGSKAGKDRHMIVSGPTRAISRNRKWLATKGVKPFTVHDLRRTGATHLPRLGVSRSHVSLVLNHAQTGITAEAYDWYEYLDEKRAALDLWAEHLDGLITGRIKHDGDPDSGDEELVEVGDED
jgi:integrase